MRRFHGRWMWGGLAVLLLGLGILAATPGAFRGRADDSASFASGRGFPPLERPIGATFGGRVELLGYDLEGVPVRSGESFKIRYYWRALEPMSTDYAIFVHFEGPGSARFQQDHDPQAGRHPTTRWQPGEDVVEEYDVRVPNDLAPGIYEIGVGVWDPRGSGDRLRVEAPDGIARRTKAVVGRFLVVSSRAERLPKGIPGRIAFQSNRDGSFNIYVMDGEGVRRVTDGAGKDMNPAWSPDGTRIAFFSSRDGNREIYVVNADGTNLRRLTFSPGNDENPAWSPDGRSIAFDSDRNGALNVWIMDSDGGNQRQLTNYRIGKAAIPAWSPDGRWIAFTSNMRLGWRVSVIDVEGQGERVVASERGDCRPDWSPDGRAIAFVSVRGDGKGDIWTVDRDGSKLRRVTTDATRYDYHPAWSPDGQRLVFASGLDKRSYKLFVIDSDGSNRRQITFGQSYDAHPSWTR